jgi:hypothetical protein
MIVILVSLTQARSMADTSEHSVKSIDKKVEEEHKKRRKKRKKRAFVRENNIEVKR